jgi:hypothetical protein
MGFLRPTSSPQLSAKDAEGLPTPHLIRWIEGLTHYGAV